MLNADRLRANIRRNIRRNKGEYVPAERTLFNIPKAGFTLRYALETALSDRVVYHALACKLMPAYDPLVPWNSFSHRLNPEKARKVGSGTFKPAVESWKCFIGVTRSSILPNTYLVSTDIANYYDSIQIDRLERVFNKLLPSTEMHGVERESAKACVDTLFNFLRRWSFDHARGLPQNRDASSFLANIYMHEVDTSMRSSGYAGRYFRYMDDIRIVCDSHFAARAAIRDLTVVLRSMGLSLNAQKTSIVHESDTEKLHECLPTTPQVLEQIDALWRKKNRTAIFKLWPLLRDRIFELAAAEKIDGREFKYCIRRVAMLASFKNLYFPKELYQPITKVVCDGLISHPSCTETFTDYLQAVDVDLSELGTLVEYLSDERRSIYSWQNYRLWLLFVQKDIRSEELIQSAMDAVLGPDTPARAGASLYLGTLRHGPGTRLIAERFRQLKTFIGQRLAIIALHEETLADNADAVRNVLPDLQGVRRQLFRSSPGTYAELRERPTIEGGSIVESSYD